MLSLRLTKHKPNNSSLNPIPVYLPQKLKQTLRVLIAGHLDDGPPGDIVKRHLERVKI